MTGPRISTSFEAGYRPWSRPFCPVDDHYVSSVNVHVPEVILSGDKLPAAHPQSSCSLRLPAAELHPKLRLRTDCHGNRPAHGGEVRLTQRNNYVRTIVRATSPLCRKTQIDYFANAFELFLSSSKRSNSAICMQVAASFLRLLRFTEVSKEVSYSKMLSSTALKHWVVCLCHASPNRRHLIILR